MGIEPAGFYSDPVSLIGALWKLVLLSVCYYLTNPVPEDAQAAKMPARIL